MKEIEEFKRSIDQGEKKIGAAVTFGETMAAELISRHFDFLWIDMEHSALSLSDVEGHILIAKKNGIPALVRVPELNMAWIKRVLDAGAHGIIVPQLFSPEEIKKVVEYGRYIPIGKRGFGPRVPYEYGQMGGAKEYLKWANENIYLAPQIETKQAYQNLDKILSIEGYDALCIGPADLSISMGFEGDIECVEMMNVYRDIIYRTKQSGKQVGFGMGIQTDYAIKLLKIGVDWLQIGSDFDFINQYAAQTIGEIKEAT